MRIVIEGRDLPGRSFGSYADVHVALQVRTDPVGDVPGDAPTARWETDVRRVDGDFRGPAVHGRRGDRFLYLTWGAVDGSGARARFRRAKLMLDRVDPDLVRRAEAEGRPLVATVSLTDDCGGPRCARVDPPAISWALGEPPGQAG